VLGIGERGQFSGGGEHTAVNGSSGFKLKHLNFFFGILEIKCI